MTLFGLSKLSRCTLVALAATIVCMPAAGQEFPSRSMRIVSPFAPGGGSDIMARALAQKLTEMWGHQVIVDNRPGATGIIGAEIVAKSAPDGHTMLLGNTATQAVNVSMFRKLPYHPVRDLTCISEVGRLPLVLVVHPSLPVKTIKDLIAFARARPNQLLFGSAGAGSPPHLAGELFSLKAHVRLVHVPYKGGPLALTDVMSGQISMYFSNALTALRLVNTGRLKALGVSSLRRMSAAPELPTISESGLPGYEEYIWFVIAVPAATPATIVKALNAGVVSALKSSEVSSILIKDGAEITPGTSEHCTTFTESEIRKYQQLLRDAGIAAAN